VITDETRARMYPGRICRLRAIGKVLLI